MTHRGLEILDFRDSWLREIAAYQEHVKANELINHVSENVNNSVGSHFFTPKLKNVPQTRNNKVPAEREVITEKPQQYIVNTYHAKLLKKENKLMPDSLVHEEHKQQSSAKVSRASVEQKESSRTKRANKTNKTRSKSTSSSLHSKVLVTPRKQTKLKNVLKKQKTNGKSSDDSNPPIDYQTDEILATVAPQIFAHPSQRKLLNHAKEQPMPINTSLNVPSKLMIPEAYKILESIHQALNGVKIDEPLEAQPEKFHDVNSMITKQPSSNDLIRPVPAYPAKKSSVVAPTQSSSLNTSASNHSSVDARIKEKGDKLDADDSSLDNELLDIIDDQSTSSTDTEAEYNGHVYLSDDEEEDTPPSLSSTKNADPETNAAESQKYYTPTSVLMPSLFPLIPPYVTFSSHIERGPSIPTDLQRVLKWKITSVTPKIVRYVITNSGIRLLKKTHDWMGTWDKHMKSPLFKEILPYQKYNHIPGSFKIGRKDSVWKNLKVMLHQYGKKEFGFMRRTYILPEELQELKRTWFKYAQRKTKWILKPPASARGVGVKLVSKWSEIPQTDEATLIQKYIERPLLINGNKFDLRLYVLITSMDPLRIYLHTDGLARFASVQYSGNMETIHDRCMHLTNYSINKFSQNYVKNEDVNGCSGHKWTLKSLWSYLESQNINTKRIWGKIKNLVVRTVLVGENGIGKLVRHTLTSKYCCYELYGFDVLLDENLTPWLLEVNISPSLHTELPLDQHVKGPLVQTVLNTACFQVPPKLTKQQQKDILTQFNLTSPLCYDRRLYLNILSNEESSKHQRFTSKSIKCRDDYLDAILENLTPDDVRCLIIAEDELARSTPLERIFPRTNSHTFLQYLVSPRYYNLLLDAWETRYASKRDEGIKYLRKLCAKGIHLRVAQTSLLTPDLTFDSDDDGKSCD